MDNVEYGKSKEHKMSLLFQRFIVFCLIKYKCIFVIAFHNGLYSVLKAVTGSFLAALEAGMMPAMLVKTIEMRMTIAAT